MITLNIWALLGIILAAVLVGYVLGRSRKRNVYIAGDMLMEHPAAHDMNMVRGDDIRSLVQAGRKIEAIKLLRHQTGMSLKEAKDAVDNMTSILHSPGRFDGVQDGLVANAKEQVQQKPNGRSGSLAQNDEIRKLIRSGNKIAAIKRYREETGLGLKEAKDAVERMAADMRRSGQ